MKNVSFQFILIKVKPLFVYADNNKLELIGYYLKSYLREREF